MHDEAGWLKTDQGVLIVKINADDPRTYPTQVVTLACPAQGWDLAHLEAVSASMAKEYQWGLGHIEQISKHSGGIGSSGADVFSLVLGVIGVVPSVLDLYRHFAHREPVCPDHDKALHQASWAIALAYPDVTRASLTCVADIHHTDHYTFQFILPHPPSNDRNRFEVDVYGNPDTVVATHVSRLNGNAWGDHAPSHPPVTNTP